MMSQTYMTKLNVNLAKTKSKMKTWLPLVPALGIGMAALALTGCRTTVAYPEAPPRYGESVQVIAYDTTPRPFNEAVQVFSNPQDVQGRPRHPIAELEKVGWYRDRALIENALIWRAKSLGADGVILLPPNFGEFEAVPFGPVGRKFNFRAEAFTWPRHNGAATVPPAGTPAPPAELPPAQPPATMPPPVAPGTPPPPAGTPAPQ